jgi:hypothetical protein
VLGDTDVQLDVLIVHGETELGIVVARRKASEHHVHLLGEPAQLETLRRSGALRKQPRRL